MGKGQITDIAGGETPGNQTRLKLKELFDEHNATPERYIETLVQESAEGTPGGLSTKILMDRLKGNSPSSWARTGTGEFTLTKEGAFACGEANMAVRFAGFKADSLIDWVYIDEDSIKDKNL